MKTEKRVRIGTVIFLVVVTAIIACTGTYFYVSGLVGDIGKSQQMYMQLSNVEQLVTNNYVRPIGATSEYEEMQDGIIEGYVNGLGDPYSYYLSEKNYKASAPSAQQIDSGIRAAYDRTTESIAVRFVRYDSPAFNAGVRIGDVILAVDDISVTELGYKAALRRLSADEDETVTVSVLRSGEADLLSLTLQYAKYAERVLDWSVNDAGYGYLAIYEFCATTAEKVRGALTSMTESYHIKGLVVDVRGNADGDYDSMVAVANLLLPPCTVGSRQMARVSDAVMYVSSGSGLTVPLCVLQDETTSGAAELFCAACSENDIASTVGTKTAGVGLGQREFALSNGTALVLSVYEYITPMGNTIESVGVMPSFEVVRGDEGDAPLTEAYSYLYGQNGEDEPDEPPVEPTEPEDSDAEEEM